MNFAQVETALRVLVLCDDAVAEKLIETDVAAYLSEAARIELRDEIELDQQVSDDSV